MRAKVIRSSARFSSSTGHGLPQGVSGGIPDDLLRGPGAVVVLSRREDMKLLDGGRSNGGGAEQEESGEDFAMEHGRTCREESKSAWPTSSHGFEKSENVVSSASQSGLGSSRSAAGLC
jgi:hypothetical protein